MLKISDLFSIDRGEFSSPLRDLSPGAVPLVSASGVGNGVVGLFDIPAPYRDCLTIGTLQCDAFLQRGSFNATGDVLLLTPRANLLLCESLFVCYVLKKYTPYFGYSRRLSPSRLSSFEIPEFPEWVYSSSIPVYLRSFISGV